MCEILANMFTNLKKRDIITLPNNLNIHSYRSFFRCGITIAFFAIQLSELILVKMLLLLDCIEDYAMKRLFGDNWSERFRCADFGWRTFYFMLQEQTYGQQRNHCAFERTHQNERRD